jgi:hypothetical protein
LLEVDESQVGQLHQQLAEEAKKGKALLDQLQNMEAKLVVCDQNHQQLMAQLQNMSCDLQKMVAKLAGSELRYMNEVGSKLADTQKNREQVANLQQRLTDEANKGKALLDQLENMESKLVDTEKHREKVSCERAATQLQVQKVRIKIHVLALQHSIRIMQSTNPGMNDRSNNCSSN